MDSSSPQRNLVLQSSANIPKGRCLITLEYDVNTPRASSMKFGQIHFHVNIPWVIKASVTCCIACPEKEPFPIPSEFGGALRSYHIEERYDGSRHLDDVSYIVNCQK